MTAFTADPPLVIGMVAYPGMTLLDLAGPQGVWGMFGRTHMLAAKPGLCSTDSGISVHVDTAFDDCPEELAILFVPGGFGYSTPMEDPETIAFLKRIAPRSRYVTSVCTGSLVLAAAGLLAGYRATCHWGCRDQLSVLGAIPVESRVVVDRNRITGGGVTAGIDFGLTLLAELRGEDVAKAVQLGIEYDPEPPFNTGTPRRAGPQITGIAEAMMADIVASGLAAAQRIAASQSSLA